MVANLLSFLLARHYQPVPVYEALLRQDNVHLAHRAGSTSRRAKRAQDVMTPASASLEQPPSLHVHPDHDLAIVLERLAESDGTLPVVSRADSRLLVGTIGVDTIRASNRRSRPA
jgi:hypothetical protein